MNYIIILFCLIIQSFQLMAQNTADDSINFRVKEAPLPRDFVLEDRSGVTYSLVDVIEGRNFFFVMFNPTCDHCEDMARQFMRYKEQFENNTVFWVAGKDMGAYLPQFVKNTGWVDSHEMKLCIDKSNSTEVMFSYGGLPQINVYNSALVLEEIFVKKIPIDKLLKFVKD